MIKVFLKKRSMWNKVVTVLDEQRTKRPAVGKLFERIQGQLVKPACGQAGL